jgi:hypothetical protein
MLACGQEEGMLTVRISEAVIEEKIRSLARAHGKSPDDIVMGSLAESMGVPEVLMTLQFPLSFEFDEYAPVPMMVPA